MLGAVAKFGMGMVHGDGNTRQCMATAVVAYKQAFGFDAPPYTYADLEESDVHRAGRGEPVHRPPDPVGARHAESAPARDHRRRPARTETAMAATQHLPVRPKSDLTLLYGLANLLIERGAIDRRSSPTTPSGFEAFAAFVRRFDPACVAARHGPGAAGDRDARRHDRAAASASRSGGRWGSTRATRGCARRRRSSTWRC